MGRSGKVEPVPGSSPVGVAAVSAELATVFWAARCVHGLAFFVLCSPALLASSYK